ncbi:O-antigen ligase family protein [Methylobacter sp. YRD-M1]|uniref:O-antigen ligase family protein n=1 Tax=Methylobacter sp. YRD-M1 TaxID=2911520 RepID=UPI00227D3C1B|nr:O-antigen ligase family protein [Methylobacter sp. YRD-M1]WAK01554.1 O-antigen ligase family protein [Methylobacter sp. YRD-M1]
MIFYSLLAVVFLSPLPYGANRPWSWSLCSLLVALLAMAWAVQFFVRKRQTPFFQHWGSVGDAAILFFAALCWAWLQTTGEWLRPLWQTQNELLNFSSGAVSLNPADTMTSVMRLLSYALVFWLALCYGQDRHKAKSVFYGLMVAGFVYSAYGLIVQLGDFRMVLWHERPYADSVSSTFINRNHFATFAGLTLLCSLALLSERMETLAEYNLSSNFGRQRFIENLITQAWFPLLAFFTISSALILSHSRGGFLSFSLALSAFLMLFYINPRTRNKNTLVIFGSLVVLGAVAFFFSSDALLDRFGRLDEESKIRTAVYGLTWNAITSNPWAGFGLGSYKEAFQLYQSMEIGGIEAAPLIHDYAHNTYLETVFELGFPAALALFYCFFKITWLCLKGFLMRKRDMIYSAIGVAATVLIGGHSLVDFSMQIPAVSYVYALLMGVACAQSFSFSAQPRAMIRR